LATIILNHPICIKIGKLLLLTKLMTELTQGQYLKTKRQMTGPDVNLTKKYPGLLGV
jgi:hypothetical protein